MKYRQFQPRYSYKVYSCKKIVYILITFSFFQIQELGLQQQYNNNRGMYRYLRQIMALAFPPEDEIEPMFEHLKAQAATDQLRQFVEYVSQTWIHNQTWPPSSWSVYMMAIRSNNDIEGKVAYAILHAAWPPPSSPPYSITHSSSFQEKTWKDPKGKVSFSPSQSFCSLGQF